MKTTTTNGMGAYTTSLNACVDLFFKIGASRGKDILPSFKSAFTENPEYATKIALWVRDIRGGSGERQLFKNILGWLAHNDLDTCKKILCKIPELGRFDDLFVLFGTPAQNAALDIVISALNDKNGLCAKWCPRQGPVANAIRIKMGLTPKAYRKLVVSLTTVVETKMCNKDWDSIEFDKLPSLAASRYQKAFLKHAAESYMKYRDSLMNGTAKINASAVYPYDIIKSLRNGGDATICGKQWEALPNYMEGCSGNILPVVDVSGSMDCCVGGSSKVTCMDVAISLGLYICERNSGTFKNKFITFSNTPTILSVSGDLQARLNSMQCADWWMNTNLYAVFNLILNSAKMFSVKAADMPSTILIMSDMQFDRADTSTTTAIGMISKEYENAGYQLPKVVFWNLNAHANVPTTFNKLGVAMVSGFSPAIMKSLLVGEIISPEQVMLATIMNERYAL